jgi:glycosyltransferase involved in cell wall biosynthesis
MATNVPILFPKNTSLVEIIGESEERGWFCKSGDSLNHFICLGQGDNNILRPTVDIYDMADMMSYIYSHPKEAKEKANRAYKEVWTWEQVGKDWLKVFEIAEVDMKIKRGLLSFERNEKCFCGSEKKFKHCHGR